MNGKLFDGWIERKKVMSENLKPCPFCGGEADCNDTGICDKDGNSLWWVECLWCGISTNGHSCIQEAMKTWNRRDGERKDCESNENQ